MVDYSLENLDSGEVDLPSGVWRSYVIRLYSLPERTCVSQMLLFGNLDQRGDTMRKRLPGSINQISAEELRGHAMHADEREFVDGEKRIVLRPPLVISYDSMWSFRDATGQQRGSNIHIEVPIGSLTMEQIREIVRP